MDKCTKEKPCRALEHVTGGPIKKRPAIDLEERVIIVRTISGLIIDYCPFCGKSLREAAQ